MKTCIFNEDGGWKTENGKSFRRPSSIFHLPSSFLLIAILLAQFCVGCRTTKPLPRADFSAPGWRVQQGQAVWKPTANRPELAGDLLFATNANGNFFIQFSKTPFQLATAEVVSNRWQIEFGNDQYSRCGSGVPPKRFSWFELPRALNGQKLDGNWHFARGETNWRLENPRTGEILEGGFFP